MEAGAGGENPDGLVSATFAETFSCSAEGAE